MDGASHQSPQIIRAEEVDGIRPVRLERLLNVPTLVPVACALY